MKPARSAWPGVGSTEREDSCETSSKKNLIDRGELSNLGRSPEKERWAGSVDVAGSQLLANICAAMPYLGVVTTSGLAAGTAWLATVTPFILRGVTLASIDSVMASMSDRIDAWDRLAKVLNIGLSERRVQAFDLDQSITIAPTLLAGQIRRRLVVRVGGKE